MRREVLVAKIAAAIIIALTLVGIARADEISNPPSLDGSLNRALAD